MALLASPAPYKGADRSAAKAGLINFVRATRPHVVGLSEVFVDGERSDIKSALADIYRFTHEGPDESDLESDGGLLLLSQFPIAATDQTIYRACLGEDCLANKGVLKARIDLPGVTDVDVYLTHLQSPNVQIGAVPSSGPGSSGTDKVKYQLTVLSEFVAATRNRSIPALIMGDINVDGRNATLYNDMMARLGHPIDVWLASGTGGLGITNGDPVSNFAPGTPFASPSDPRRFQSGSRLDYFFGYNGTRFRPSFSSTRVVVAQTLAGRDISDHYGIMTTISGVRLLEPTYTRDPASVTARLTKFHCLMETDGPIAVVSRELSADEVEFQMRLTPSVGTALTSSLTPRQEDVVRGVNRTFSSPRTLSVANPGSVVSLRAEGWEVDEGPFGIVTGRASLGSSTISLHRNELFDSFLAPFERKLRLRSSAGGEYIATVSISAR
jgi:endonuclease/exonuclease/phosphatase family metal-dependent hydrolase